MRAARVWKQMIGVDDRTVIEDVEFEANDTTVVVCVRPRRPTKRRCGRCDRPAPGYDSGEGRRRWRGLDLGTVKVMVEADAPRVECPDHGVVVAAVPWARHGAGFTRDFEDQTAWLATHASKSAITQLVRIAWVTVGRIIARVVAERGEGVDPLEGLRRIGIDEISHLRGATTTSLSWLTTSPAAWCGSKPAGPKRRWRRSLTTWVRPAVHKSAWSAPMPRSGLMTSSRPAAPTRCGAWTRSM